ncbi:hypothetical protein [Idiomarina loihiensis]|uniref:hypothetical protein n=1 Tax=Idiomarina loihiensis TaxID=135577 RepID=UPI00384C2E81
MTRQNIEATKEIVAHIYGKANSYSNLIIVAGYVGFFTLWSSIRPELPNWAVLSSGGLILTSLMIFIAFEFYKMTSISIQMHRISKRLDKPNMGTLDEIQDIQKRSSLNNAKAWIFTVIPTIVSGFLAGLILLYCFLIELLPPLSS